MNNKIIEVQEILFKEMKRLNKDELFSIEPKITKLGILNSKLKIKTKVVYDEK